MASNAKATLIKRLASTPGKGLGANTGLGSADIVVPEFPKLPQRLTEQSVREFAESVDRWRSGLQAQFPVPTTQAASVADPSAQISTAVDSAIETFNKQIEALNATISSKAAELQKQIDSIDVGSITASDVQTIITNARYVHSQGVPVATWTIRHNLGWYPSVTLIDMSNNVFCGNITYLDKNTCEVALFSEVSGYAYVN
jgi:hypothetical protein